MPIEVTDHAGHFSTASTLPTQLGVADQLARFQAESIWRVGKGKAVFEECVNMLCLISIVLRVRAGKVGPIGSSILTRTSRH
jgi:hypothetical protein